MLCRLRESENQFFAVRLNTEVRIRIGGPGGPELVGKAGDVMLASGKGDIIFQLAEEFQARFEPIESALAVSPVGHRKAGKPATKPATAQPEGKPPASEPPSAPPPPGQKTSLLQRVREALLASNTGMSREALAKDLSATSGKISMSLSYLKKEQQAFKVDGTDLWRLTNSGRLAERQKRIAAEQQ